MFNLENQAEAFFIAEAPISYCQVFDKQTEDEHHLKSAETRVEVGGLLPTAESAWTVCQADLLILQTHIGLF